MNSEHWDRPVDHASLDDLLDAKRALLEDGYLLLKNAIAPSVLDALRDKMEEDTERIRAKRRKEGRDDSRFLQVPPPFAPYVAGQVVANPQVCRITREVLGSGVYCNLYSANTNCPGSSPQPVHVDMGQLWQGLDVGHPSATLVVNIPLVETHEENGTIELWPGTHLDPRPTYLVGRHLMNQRRGTVPPIQARMPIGSILIRDPRIWHRGLPNLSDQVRHMLTMNHNVFWLERGPQVRFVRGCEAAFEGTDLRWHLKLVEYLFEYLETPA